MVPPGQDPEERRDPSAVSLFLPQGQKSADASRGAWTVPPYLAAQAGRRLQMMAICYTLAFILADFVSSALMHGPGAMFGSPARWIPSIASVGVGIGVAALAGSPRLDSSAKIHLGLAFLVVSCYGIALAQYLTMPEELASSPIVLYVLSPSWVGVWMVVYAVVVPSPPGRALIALLLAATAPAVVIGSVLYVDRLQHLMSPSALFLHHVFPYLICVGLAYSAAKIVYRLGADVSRAQELGSYRLVERLGEGGMGEVWRATHQLLARPAAIKFIRPGSITGSDPEDARTILRRFELEARATASLTSEHTIDLYDFGVAGDGTFYYVMELLDGMDCERLVQQFGPLPPARVVHLLRQMAESLEEAHGKGLVHRDVKPANVYLCRSGSRLDFVKVLDFGLVARHHAPSEAETRLTLPERTIGTPQFMAPEMALGQPVDGRADLYGLGGVAYWLVTGRPVFEGGSLFEIISKHLHVIPEPPSRHAPNGVPPQLDALVMSLLEKDPARRPPDARALIRQLAEVPVGEGWGDEHAAAWWAEHVPASPGGHVAATAEARADTPDRPGARQAPRPPAMEVRR